MDFIKPRALNFETNLGKHRRLLTTVGPWSQIDREQVAVLHGLHLVSNPIEQEDRSIRDGLIAPELNHHSVLDP
jgi:hypothetical protein